MKSVLEFKKDPARKISMLTCYDYSFARLIAESPVDAVLVGDSLSMVMHGDSSTLSADVELMALHTRAVAKGLRGQKFLVGDMPFPSFRKGIPAAMEAVDALMKAGAQAVKIEGVWGHEDVIRHVVESGVPVMGHLGLTPQSVNKFGGFKVQGKEKSSAEDILEQARKLQELGCFAMVLECLPFKLAAEITAAVHIPTIGIGAGSETDGQVLVLQDMLGMNADFMPRFVRRFLAGKELIGEALQAFHASVQEESFPNAQEAYL